MTRLFPIKKILFVRPGKLIYFQNDVFDENRTKKISDRESEYQRKGRRNLQISPERADPFAEGYL